MGDPHLGHVCAPGPTRAPHTGHQLSLGMTIRCVRPSWPWQLGHSVTPSGAVRPQLGQIKLGILLKKVGARHSGIVHKTLARTRVALWRARARPTNNHKPWGRLSQRETLSSRLAPSPSTKLTMRAKAWLRS